MEAMKQLGNNGGGFFNTNSAHPFENPTGLTNWLSIFLLLAIPFSLTYTFGKMVGKVRQGVALLAVMVLIFGVWVGYTAYAEHQPNPAVAAAGVSQPTGNMEGKNTMFGDTTTALFGVSSTNTSTGSADASYDSFNPIGGMGLLTGMMLGEVTPGGAGSGLYTLLDLRPDRRVHRGADDRANAGVPGQEDPGQGDQAGRPGRPSSCPSPS